MTDQVDARELLYEGKAKKLFATGDPKRDLGGVEEAYQEIARRVGA